VQVVIPSLGSIEAARPLPVAAAPSADVAARPAPSDPPRLEVAAPQPGASVGRSFAVQGIVAGADHVDVFLEPDRDAGGALIGSGTPGELSPAIRLGRPLGAGEFIAPTNGVPRGSHILYVHAHSSITGQEIVLTIPVTVS
jgi:hypothetical protein